MEGMETDDPFASLGGLGSGLGGSFGPRNPPFRSQSFNVGSNSGGGKKDKVQDPAVEHDLYVSLDDICKVRQPTKQNLNQIIGQRVSALTRGFAGRDEADEDLAAGGGGGRDR